MEDFYIVLPSNSSRSLFPENSATHFTTQLPQNFCLHGEWCVGLAEIQVPLTFQHISSGEKEGIICVKTRSINSLRDADSVEEMVSQVKPGIYYDVKSLLNEINNLSSVKGHLTFEIQCGGYVQVSCVCSEDCMDYTHTFTLSKKICEILGLEKNELVSCHVKEENFIIGNRPANLINSLPPVLMIYSNICQPYVTGDTQTRLLRAVPLRLYDYVYGSTEIKNFTPPMYLPLLSSSFQTIEIDIKDQQGNPISFDYGALTVTLHFKRIN